MLTEEASKCFRLRSGPTAGWRAKGAELFQSQQRPHVVYVNEQQGVSEEEEDGKEGQEVIRKLEGQGKKSKRTADKETG